MSAENILGFINDINNSKEELTMKEQKLLSLLPQCKEAKDKGMVLAAIAKAYFQSGTSQSEKVVDYCSKAIQYPLEILEACDVYMMWGETLDKEMPSNASLKGDARKTVCTPYIKAMDLVLQNLKEKKRMPPPAVGKFDAMLEDPSYQELKKKNEDQIEQRKYIVIQNKLLWYKQVLREKLVHFYGKGDSAALKADVREIIPDENKVALICSALQDETGAIQQK